MEKILGADAYFGIKIRKPDGTYQILDDYDNISLALRFAEGQEIYGRKIVVEPDEGEDMTELIIEKYSTTLYYMKVPRDRTINMPEGIGSIELSVLTGDNWKTISKFANIRWVQPKARRL